MSKLCTIFLSVCMIFSLLGCGSSGGGSSSSTTAILTGDAIVRGTVQGDGVSQIPVYLISPEAVPAAINSNIRANIAGTWYATTTDAAGNYQFNNVVEGSYNLIAQKDRYHSAVQKNVQILRAATTNLNLTLTATGDISGKLALQTGVNFSGIFVYIPGTSFVGTVAEDGSFSITGVPAGTYELNFKGDSVKTLALPNISVIAGQTNSAGAAIAIESVEGATIEMSITEPQNNAIFYPEDLNEINVQVSDPQYGIDRVILMTDGLKMIDTNAPFSFPLIASVSGGIAFNQNGLIIGSGAAAVEYSGLSVFSEIVNYEYPTTFGYNYFVDECVPWAKGPNSLKIIAVNSDGKSKELNLMVNFAPSKPSLIESSMAMPMAFYKYSKDSGLSCVFLKPALGDYYDKFTAVYYAKLIETQQNQTASEIITSLTNAEVVAFKQEDLKMHYSLNGLEFNKSYAIAAKASIGSVDSRWTYEGNFNTSNAYRLMAAAVPVKPSIYVATNTKDLIQIRVSPVSNWEADSYVLEYSNSQNTATNTVALESGTQIFEINDRVAAAKYFFNVKAVYGSTASEYASAEAQGFTIVDFGQTITTLTTTGAQILLKNYTGNNSCTLVDTNGVGFNFTKDDTISGLVGYTVLKVNTTTISTLAAFSAIELTTTLPAGTLIEVTQGGTVVASAEY